MCPCTSNHFVPKSRLYLCTCVLARLFQNATNQTSCALAHMERICLHREHIIAKTRQSEHIRQTSVLPCLHYVLQEELHPRKDPCIAPLAKMALIKVNWDNLNACQFHLDTMQTENCDHSVPTEVFCQCHNSWLWPVCTRTIC